MEDTKKIAKTFRDRSVRCTIGGLLSGAAIFLFFLLQAHRAGLFQFLIVEQGLSGFSHVSGHAYSIPLGFEWLSDSDLIRFYVPKVMEDGKPLNINTSNHSEIINEGKGRYSIWHGTLYLSATDNSAPGENGRRYSIVWPLPVPSSIVLVINLLAGVGAGYLLYRGKGGWLGHKATYWIVVTGFVLFVVVTRSLGASSGYLPPSVTPDSATYVMPATEIVAGHMPDFGIRTPGYPLLLAFVLFVSGKLKTVVLLNVAATVLAGVAFIYAFRVVYPFLVLPAAVVFGAYVSTGTYLAYEITVMPDTIFSALLVTGFALLLVGIYRRSPWSLALSSLSFACAIWTKPAGLFLLVIFVLAALFIYLRGYGIKALGSFCLPFLLMYILLSTYNYMKSGYFSPSTFGGANLVATTFLLWEEDPKFDSWVNSRIRYAKEIVPPEDIKVIYDSVDLDEVAAVHAKHYGYVRIFLNRAFPLKVRMRHGYAKTTDESSCKAVSVDKLLKLQKDISYEALRSHWSVYIKIVAANLKKFFLDNVERDWLFFTYSLPSVYKWWASIDDDRCAIRLMRSAFSDFNDNVRNAKKVLADLFQEEDVDVSKLGFAGRYMQVVMSLSRAFVRSQLWVWGYFAAAGFSLMYLFRNRVVNGKVFFLFLLCAGAFGGALLVSLVEPALLRYSFSISPLYYFSVLVFVGVVLEQAGIFKIRDSGVCDEREQSNDPGRVENGGARC